MPYDDGDATCRGCNLYLHQCICYESRLPTKAPKIKKIKKKRKKKKSG